MISYISASHNPKILEVNLMHSKIAREQGIYIEEDCKNVAKAYNWLSAGKGMCCFIHHDVILPDSFEEDVMNALKEIPDNFGVIGVAGVRLVNGKKENKGYMADRGKVWGSPIGLPCEVQTLDEVLFITHGDLIFDEQLNFDFYCADACMQMIAQGRKNYAINAFVHHNSTRAVGGRTESFYKAQDYFKEKWKDYLPIATTCCILEKEK